MGYSTSKGQPQYYVLFVGYNVSENVWLAE